MASIEASLTFSNDASSLIAGKNDEYLAVIEKGLNVRISLRGNCFFIFGDQNQVVKTKNLMQYIKEHYSSGTVLSHREIKSLIDIFENNSPDVAQKVIENTLVVTYRGGNIRAKSYGQKLYVNAMNCKDIVLAVGPAGTGKTFLAIARAIISLNNRECSRIILTRPAVEAGERLGFLPGDLQDKVDPYLRPLYDSLNEIIGPEKFARLLERGIIEVAPLAFMRGRTLDDAFVILDEAQNTTPEQMKMFLTRMGFGSRVVVTGDITQIDLPLGRASGLVDAIQRLGKVAGLSIITLDAGDVVRHPLVQQIINAYSDVECKKEQLLNE